MPTLVQPVKLSSFSKVTFTELVRKDIAGKKYIKTYDCIIIGGVLLVLLWLLSRHQGMQAVIIDNSHPREKICGGVISNRAFKKFPIIQAVPYTFDVRSPLEISSPSGQKIVFDKNRGHSVSRKILDRYILDSAIRSGAKFIQEKALSITNEDGLWIVKTDKRELRGRILIGADGVNSIVRKTVSVPFDNSDLAMGIEYLTEGDEGAPSQMQFRNTYKGYLWKVNKGMYHSIGILDSLDEALALKTDLDKFLRNNCKRSDPLIRMSALVPRASSTKLFLAPCAGKNWLLIGDAAGHVNPLTSEGVLYALWSAELAAQAINAGDTRLYDSLWREEYGKELEKAVIAQKILYSRKTFDTLVWFSAKSATLSDIVFALLSGDISTDNAWLQTLFNVPQIGIETMYKSFKSAFS